MLFIKKEGMFLDIPSFLILAWWQTIVFFKRGCEMQIVTKTAKLGDLLYRVAVRF